MTCMSDCYTGTLVLSQHKQFIVQSVLVELKGLKFLYETCQSQHYGIPYTTNSGWDSIISWYYLLVDRLNLWIYPNSCCCFFLHHVSFVKSIGPGTGTSTSILVVATSRSYYKIPLHFYIDRNGRSLNPICIQYS